MSTGLNLLIIFYWLALLALPLALYYGLRQDRRKRMLKYAALFNAESPSECMDVFRQILLDLIRREASKRSAFSKQAFAALPQSDEECYKMFALHSIPRWERLLSSLKTTSYVVPIIFFLPLLRFLLPSAERSYSFFSIALSTAISMILAISFHLLFRRFVIPATREELEVLREVDKRVVLVMKKEGATSISPAIKIILQKSMEQERTDKLFAKNVPNWVVGLVIGSLTAVVVGIFLYGLFIWKNFTVDLPSGYRYLNGEAWKQVESDLAKRNPKESLINLFANSSDDRHLIATSFTPSSGSISSVLPNTRNSKDIETFIQQHRGELAAECSMQGMSANDVTVLPLDSGYIAVRVSGNGTDIVNGRIASIEQLTFSDGKSCYRITLTNCDGGNLDSEVQSVVRTARFK